MRIKIVLLSIFCIVLTGCGTSEKVVSKEFRVIAFFTAKNDQAHISFLEEANKWFLEKARRAPFIYETTSNWKNMNTEFLSKYNVVLFLDTRPEAPEQRKAFEEYMKNGGAWMGFHFAAFALADSDVKPDWDWYHNEFLGSGEYASNTWRPTAAILRIESRHPVLKNIPATFSSAPNEWYRWKNDLRKNKDIDILLAIDEKSFPLGTGPKPYEIWHEGYYPVVWTNKKYKMIYCNMGHNDIDYEGGTNKTLSYTFENKTESRLILDALLWLGKK